MSQAVISEYYGTGGGWGFDIPVLREYPVAALARNVLVVRPALAAMLASDDSASGATLLYATLSQDWSVELTIDYFDRQAQAERVRNCKEVWFEVYGIARGYNSLSKDSPASRAGAMTVLEAIRSGDWSNKPREIYGDYTGKQIDEEIKKYPWPPKPRTPTTASAPSQPPPE